MLIALCIAACASAACAPVAPATKPADLVFICHRGLGYDSNDVRNAYRGLLDEPQPVDNRARFPQMLAFLGATPAVYKKAWERNYFRRGLALPKLKQSDDEVIEYVARRSNAIGYVSAAPNHPDVQVCGE